MWNKVRNCKRWLQVTLHSDELIEKAKTLSQLQQDLQRVEAEKAEQMREFGESIKSLKGTIRKTAEIVANGAENRTVECVEEVNLAEKKARVIRLDSGEAIQVRVLGEDELQQDLWDGRVITEPTQDESDAAESRTQAAPPEVEPESESLDAVVDEHLG